MSYSCTVEIEQLPKTANSIGKAGWWYTQAERKLWRRLVGHAFLGKQPIKPLKRSTLLCTRFSTTEPDLDNLYASFKFVIDGMKYNAIIEDDKSSNIDLKCSWTKGKRGQGKIRIEITEIQDVREQAVRML